MHIAHASSGMRGTTYNFCSTTPSVSRDLPRFISCLDRIEPHVSFFLNEAKSMALASVGVTWRLYGITLQMANDTSRWKWRELFRSCPDNYLDRLSILPLLMKNVRMMLCTQARGFQHWGFFMWHGCNHEIQENLPLQDMPTFVLWLIIQATQSHRRYSDRRIQLYSRLTPAHPPPWTSKSGLAQSRWLRWLWCGV
jgi:hypothetical protein